MRVTLGVLFVVVIALVAAGANGEDVSSMRVVVEGEHVATGENLFVVGSGTAVVPANATHDGSVYVVAGTARIEGTVRGNLVVVGGQATLADGATVTGDLQVFGGGFEDRGGQVEGTRQDSVVTDVATERGPASALSTSLLLAAVGFLLARWRPGLVENVSAAVAEHPVVSLTVGGTAAAVAVALAVLMAFTVVLVPLVLLGAVVALAVVTYGNVALGYLLGRRLPVERRDLATAAGTFGVAVLLEVLGRIPLGGLTSLTLALVGTGAVLVTYFGGVRFEPPSLA